MQFLAATADADGRVYAATPGTVFKFAEDETLISSYGMPQTSNADGVFGEFAAGEFFEPVGLAVLSNGDLIVADSNFTYSQIVRLRFGE